MAALIRCKSCGFVMEEGRQGDVCPACGVPRKMFEPFTDAVSAKRRGILDVHVHPIIVHFAVSFSVSCLALSLVILLFPGLLPDLVTPTLRLMGGALPLALIATFGSGRFDGRVRFRRAKSRLLLVKTWVGLTFFVLAAAAGTLVILADPRTIWHGAAAALLFAGCTACAFIQGRIGGRLLYALFPG